MGLPWIEIFIRLWRSQVDPTMPARIAAAPHKARSESPPVMRCHDSQRTIYCRLRHPNARRAMNDGVRPFSLDKCVLKAEAFLRQKLLHQACICVCAEGPSDCLLDMNVLPDRTTSPASSLWFCLSAIDHSQSAYPAFLRCSVDGL